MRSPAVARRYARALFSIASESSSVDAMRAELAQISALFENNAELKQALFRPLHPVAERRAVLRGVCERVNSSATLKNFMTFLIDQRRIIDYDAIQSEFGRLADAAAGLLRAEVIAASALDDRQVERLRSALTSQTGQQIELKVSVDPNLIGGAIAMVGGRVFDGSLRTQLTQLRNTLTRGQ